MLRNHLLAPGEYSLRVSGDPGVYWKFYGAVRPTGKFQNGDPVPGATFDQTIKLRILPATEAELRAAYAPYIAAIDMEFPSYPSRDAIAEMAPPFLEKTILSFATQPQSAFLAVRGLERIDTAESRTDLAALYKKSYDLHLRVAIVEALARMNSVDQLSFMASLLAGPSSEADDYIHEYAALGAC